MTHNSRVDARQRPQQSSAWRQHCFGPVKSMVEDKPSLIAKLWRRA